eukprot:TRINITY_DN14427_c0_g1_i1.p1 TRINITY_DN14427_c0_g1~~TRINITY_DN14427_c0_g1_i1.p1  ORF type:complete len:1120 (-),score=263.05 TRINITY_DN14427_c0_g1_i1:118-3477(-)
MGKVSFSGNVSRSGSQAQIEAAPLEPLTEQEVALARDLKEKKEDETELLKWVECEHVRAMFDEFDVNRDGLITLNEWRQVMKCLDPSFPEVSIRTLFEAADLDGEGSVDRLEFFSFLFGTERSDTVIDSYFEKQWDENRVQWPDPEKMTQKRNHLTRGMSRLAISEFIAEIGFYTDYERNEETMGWVTEEWGPGMVGYDVCEAVRGFLEKMKYNDFSATEVFENLDHAGAGRADVFISHAQCEALEMTLDCLRLTELRMGGPVRCFLDYTSLRQCLNDFDLAAVCQAIRSIGHTILVVDKWDRPFTLSRTFCIFEIYATVGIWQHNEGILDVILPKAEQKEFCIHFSSLTKEEKREALQLNVKVEDAEARHEKDKIALDNYIIDTSQNGFEDVNQKVSASIAVALEECLVQEADRTSVELVNVLEQKVQAAEALTMDISREDLRIIKSLPVPPRPVLHTVRAMCLLFSHPADNWKDHRRFLTGLATKMTSKPFSSYDPKSLSPETLRELDAIYNKPDFDPKVVTRASREAGKLCVWIRAVYEYVKSSQDALSYKEALDKTKEAVEVVMDETSPGGFSSSPTLAKLHTKKQKSIKAARRRACIEEAIETFDPMILQNASVALSSRAVERQRLVATISLVNEYHRSNSSAESYVLMVPKLASKSRGQSRLSHHTMAVTGGGDEAFETFEFESFWVVNIPRRCVEDGNSIKVEHTYQFRETRFGHRAKGFLDMPKLSWGDRVCYKAMHHDEKKRLNQLLNQHNMLRTPKERDLLYAARLADYFSSNVFARDDDLGDYEEAEIEDGDSEFWQPSVTCKEGWQLVSTRRLPFWLLERGRGTMLAFNVCFVYALRSQGIPARLCMGTSFGQSIEKWYDKQFVRSIFSEFFCEGVGWIPCEASIGTVSFMNHHAGIDIYTITWHPATVCYSENRDLYKALKSSHQGDVNARMARLADISKVLGFCKNELLSRGELATILQRSDEVSHDMASRRVNEVFAVCSDRAEKPMSLNEFAVGYAAMLLGEASTDLQEDLLRQRKDHAECVAYAEGSRIDGSFNLASCGVAGAVMLLGGPYVKGTPLHVADLVEAVMIPSGSKNSIHGRMYHDASVPIFQVDMEVNREHMGV